MNTVELTLSGSNAGFAGFKTKRSKANRVDIKLSEVKHKATRTVLPVVYEVLSGQGFDPEVAVATASYKSELFNRIYGPCLCAQDDSLVLTLADQVIEIKPGWFKGVEISTEAYGKAEIEASFSEFDINGKGNDVCFQLEIYFEKNDTLIRLYATLRLQDYNAERNTATELVSMAKRSYKGLVGLLGGVPTGSGSDGDTYSMGTLVVGTTYSVIGYRELEIGDRVAYILQLDAKVAGAYHPDPTSRDATENHLDSGVETFSVWANKGVSTSLALSPTITPEKPAELVVSNARVRKDGVVIMTATLIADLDDSDHGEEINFDFG